VTFRGNVRYPALSADGRHLAYMVQKKAGGSGLWVKDLDSGSAIEIFSAPRCWIARWSPDGSRLLFGAIHAETDMGTYIIPRLGGEPRKIFDSPWPWCAWSPDGSRVAKLAVGVNEVTILDLDAGDTRVIDLGAGVARTGELNYLDWSPAHDRLLFQVDDTRYQSFWTIRPDGTEQTRLMEVRYDPKTLIANPRWAPQGDAVYYFRYGVRGQGVMDLMKIPVDRETGATAGDPVTVLSGLHTTDDGYSISGDGTRFLYVQETNYTNLWLVRVEGEAGSFVTKKTQLTTGATWKSRAEISPDGTRIVFGMSSGEASNIYSMRLPDEAGGTAAIESPRQLTFFNSLTDVPVWSPDGSEIAFYSAQGGMPRVWRMSNAGGTPKPFEEAEFESFVGDHLAWAPAGKIIHRTVGIRNFSIFDPTTGASFPLVDADSLGYVFGPCWSPDGGRVAFFWNREEETPPMGAWVKDITDGTMWKIADTVVQPLAWTPDGEYIWGMRFDVTAGGLNEVFKIPARGGEPVRWVNLPFEKIDAGRVSMTPDGLTFVYSRAERHADAWIVEDFDPGAD
jgi:Tol biopolymer transport system component